MSNISMSVSACFRGLLYSILGQPCDLCFPLSRNSLIGELVPESRIPSMQIKCRQASPSAIISVIRGKTFRLCWVGRRLIQCHDSMWNSRLSLIRNKGS